MDRVAGTDEQAGADDTAQRNHRQMARFHRARQLIVRRPALLGVALLGASLLGVVRAMGLCVVVLGHVPSFSAFVMASDVR